MLAVHLPADIEKRLEELAARTGRSKNDYAREAIVEYLDDLEDAGLAAERLADLRAGKATTVPLSNLMKSYGVED